ncbi:DUF1223 domain-containing protein [Paracoccus broussonetiae]|nr:DUF1223 domain-containing protein [Paracoccus sp. CPCC 101403]
MASRLADTCARQGQRRLRCRGLVPLWASIAVAVTMTFAQGALAQDGGSGGADASATDGGMDSATGGGMGEGFSRSAPSAPGAGMDPGGHDEGGGGNIGLIEAPEGAPGIDADLLAGPDVGLFDDSPMVSAFAERRTAQMRNRQFGPIDHPPVVVELFTSQGCSSCPPADDMLADLADRTDILALSWHVDYWDYLGWADEFARPEFTRRQQAYAHSWGERAIYTPQLIVGGTDTLIAVRPAELMTLLDAQMARPAPIAVTSRPEQEGFQIELTPRVQIPSAVAIMLVRYAPKREVKIKAGENRGLTVTYRNVVLGVERIADWDGRAPLRLNVKAGLPSGESFPADTRHAILAQQLSGGREPRPSGAILAAIRLD